VLNKLKKLDLGIIAILLCLMGVSVVTVHSATLYTAGFNNLEIKQLIFYGLGFFVAIASVFFDYRIVLKSWLVLYGIGITLLILVYLVGAEINGARGWFSFKDGAISIQPAEIVKLILIIGLAYLIGRRQGDRLNFTNDLLPIFAFSFLPFLLVMIQPDLGNAIIYIVIVVGMLWIGNVKYVHAAIGLAIAVGCVVLFMSLFNAFNEEIKDFLNEQHKIHWYERINTFVNPEQASKDARHQADNAEMAIGSGGLSGQGYLQGKLKNAGFIPYAYSDSIFVVVGEEFGFQGAAILLMLYFLLIYRMIMIAFKCYDRKASYIIIGIVSMFVFQIFQNVGMMIGLMPITGITLPFVSYGGSSLIINMLSIGLVFSIKAHQEVYELAE
jgi:rod shape determining protein RodA